MINRIVAAALSQRFVVLIGMVGLAIWGVISFQRLPIDAYPDLAPPRVQIVTQWPGHAAEEVERQITIPLETEMNGIPKLDALRSISLYGLSSLTMNSTFHCHEQRCIDWSKNISARSLLPCPTTSG